MKKCVLCTNQAEQGAFCKECSSHLRDNVPIIQDHQTGFSLTWVPKEGLETTEALITNMAKTVGTAMFIRLEGTS